MQCCVCGGQLVRCRTSMYQLLRPLLFRLSADRAHQLTLTALQHLSVVLRDHWSKRTPTTLWGLDFPHCCGLAAGFDKNAVALPALFKLGFSFIEVGAVTPYAQPGNPRPHVKRLPAEQSVLNRCGFNNDGVDQLVARLRNFRTGPYATRIVGVNLGKNKKTPLAAALDDYLFCMEKVYPYSDFITINVSSPNTQGLRDMEAAQLLSNLLAGVVASRDALARELGLRRPILLKVSPDLSDKQMHQVADVVQKQAVDGLIATNTSVRHQELLGRCTGTWGGGLSGRALKQAARHALQVFYRALGDEVPIISVGGIDSIEEAQWRMDHGARLLQLYTGLIYQGPALVRAIAKDVRGR